MSSSNQQPGALLDRVRQATSIPAGLSMLRNGIADQLKSALGPEITSQGFSQQGGPGGATGQVQGQGQQGPSGMKIPQLNELYQGLITHDEEWAEALVANTPQAGGLAEGQKDQAAQTASRSAFA